MLAVSIVEIAARREFVGLIADPDTDSLSRSISVGEVKSVGLIAAPNTDGLAIGEVKAYAEIVREVAARFVAEVLVRLLAEPAHLGALTRLLAEPATRLVAVFLFLLSIRGTVVEIYCD